MHEKVYGIGENKCKVEVVSKEKLLDLIYPVGAIYMSVKNTNPGTLFGGTWTAWGAGRVPVGVNTSDSNFNSVEKTGGASNVTLTESQIPSHYHGFTDGSYAIACDGTTFGASGSDFHTLKNPTAMTTRTGNTGGGGSHNNLQPYITCYMWKRTA